MVCLRPLAPSPDTRSARAFGGQTEPPLPAYGRARRKLIWSGPTESLSCFKEYPIQLRWKAQEQRNFQLTSGTLSHLLWQWNRLFVCNKAPVLPN